MTDVRVRYTQKIIKETFLKLLWEKPVQSITVKEICERAGINRTTFYKHYRDPYDLLEQVENDAEEELLALIEEHKGRDPKTVLLLVLRVIQQHRDEILRLLQRDGQVDFLYRLTIRCFWTIRETSGQDARKGERFLADPMNFGYYVGGIGGVIGYWVGNGMKETPEEIADALFRYSELLFAQESE